MDHHEHHRKEKDGQHEHVEDSSHEHHGQVAHASHGQDSHENHHAHHDMGNLNKMASSATLHCLTGCAIGEITGLVIGTIIGLSALATVGLAVALAFLFGYALSMIPLLKFGLSFKKALPIILAADTLSIAVMEVVDNAVMLAIPGAMDAGLVNPVFWLAMPFALTVAYFAAYPVNKHLLKKNKGHALVHQYHH